MNRRQIISMLGLPLVLSGCVSEQATVRYRVIATVEVDGKRVEGSSVMEITYKRVTGSLIGMGGATTLYGEALILDLNGRGTVYVLPTWLYHDESFSQAYEFGILTTLGVKNGIGDLEVADFQRIKTATGRMPFKMGAPPSNMLPLFVAFREEKIPRTIYEVDPKNMGSHFPGARFISLDIEITDAPVTEVLKQRLPWLSDKNPAFDRDPPGKLRSNRDKPLGYKIAYIYFFGNGSR